MTDTSLNRTFTKTSSLLVIILSTSTMQIHGIEFWNWAAPMRANGLLPFTIGWVFSIALHAAMLWLWYANKRPILRWVMAALLIAGPLYQLTVPLSGDIGKSQYLSEEVEDLQAEVKQKETSLKKYQENSKIYSRSADRIAPAEASLDAARTNLRKAKAKAYKSTQESGTPLRLYAVAAMQAIILLSLLLAEISAVSFWWPTVSGDHETGETRIETISRQREMTETLPLIIDSLNNNIKDFKSWNELSDYFGFSSRDVSHVRSGKPVSKRVINNMVKKLGVEV